MVGELEDGNQELFEGKFLDEAEENDEQFGGDEVAVDVEFEFGECPGRGKEVQEGKKGVVVEIAADEPTGRYSTGKCEGWEET